GVSVLSDGYLAISFVGYAVKTDFKGNLIWSKILLDNDSAADVVPQKKVISDGNNNTYIFCTALGINHTDSDYIVKMNDTGAIVWQISCPQVELANLTLE